MNFCVLDFLKSNRLDTLDACVVYGSCVAELLLLTCVLYSHRLRCCSYLPYLFYMESAFAEKARGGTRGSEGEKVKVSESVQKKETVPYL